MNISQTIFASSLGYVPSGTPAEAPEIFSFDGISSTGRTCIDFTDSYTGAIAKTYCGYSLDTSVSWEQAFNFAKLLKGYLATITSTEEWEAIKTNLIDNSGTSYNMNTSIWIGYNKVNFSGNLTEFTWITGEKSKVNWGIDNQTEEYFDGGEPNNQGGNEGCVHVKHSNLGSDRRWNDITCESAGGTGWSAPWRHLIIEFHQ
ncbi:C-type lectin domain-containing protein [Moheibacter sp.]|uniref:C-type lectin domain-containing protein n=1 Tax=Moheibacter sp. TaxID=1965316 RepID=UPI003C783A21